MDENKKVCNCSHHKIVPTAIILLGLSFLLSSFNVAFFVSYTNIIWPILVIIIGVVKLGGKGCKCC